MEREAVLLLLGSETERGSPLGSQCLVGFLRGLLTNLGTPPITSVIRSILVRPRIVNRLGTPAKTSAGVRIKPLHYSMYDRRVKADMLGLCAGLSTAIMSS